MYSETYLSNVYIFTGTQLTICKESCNVIDVIMERCNSQFTAVMENIPDAFLYYFFIFNCSSPETYLIPGLPPDTEQCLRADDLCEFNYLVHNYNNNMHIHALHV